MAFPVEIKCIVCDCELDKDCPNSICGSCDLTSETNQTFCHLCGRAFENTNDKTLDCLKKLKDSQTLDTSGNQADILNAEFSAFLNSSVQSNNSQPNILCSKCKKQRPHFDKARSPFIYKNNVISLVYKLKYGNARFLAKYLAFFMQNQIAQFGQIDFITFVPLFKHKQKLRGYNQAHLLAKHIGENSNLKCINLLKKANPIAKYKNTAKLSRQDRIKSIQNSISINHEKNPGKYIQNKNILLVDDVLTSATTANECAKVLKQNGAKSVFVLSFATSTNK